MDMIGCTTCAKPMPYRGQSAAQWCSEECHEIYRKDNTDRIQNLQAIIEKQREALEKISKLSEREVVSQFEI